MFSRIQTILLLTRDHAIRADLRAGADASQMALTIRERMDADEPALAISTLLRGADKPGDVFVLSSDVWTRTMSLPRETARNMSLTEATQALQFEAEPLSGLNAFDGAAALVKLDDAMGHQRYWISEVSSSLRDQIESVVKDAGGNFRGLAHPGGLSVSLSLDIEALDWRRVEFWPGTVVRLAHRGRETHLRIDETGVIPGNRAATLDNWRKEFSGHAADEVLTDVPGAEPPVNAAALALSDEQLLRRWLHQWLRQLSARSPSVPIVRAEKRPLSQQQRSTISVVLAAIVGVGCYAHHLWVGGQIAAMNENRTRIEAPGKEIEALRTRGTQIEKDTATALEEAGKQRVRVEPSEKVLANQRLRIKELLERLATLKSDHWVLREIDGNGQGLTLDGVTTHPKFVAELTAAISAEFIDLGWAVDSPSQKIRYLSDQGGVWEFTLHFGEIIYRVQPVQTPQRNAVVGP